MGFQYRFLIRQPGAIGNTDAAWRLISVRHTPPQEPARNYLDTEGQDQRPHPSLKKYRLTIVVESGQFGASVFSVAISGTALPYLLQLAT